MHEGVSFFFHGGAKVLLFLFFFFFFNFTTKGLVLISFPLNKAGKIRFFIS